MRDRNSGQAKRLALSVVGAGYNVQLANKVQEITEHPPTSQVPEPGTLALLGLGLTGLAFRKRWAA